MTLRSIYGNTALKIQMSQSRRLFLWVRCWLNLSNSLFSSLAGGGGVYHARRGITGRSNNHDKIRVRRDRKKFYAFCLNDNNPPLPIRLFNSIHFSEQSHSLIGPVTSINYIHNRIQLRFIRKFRFHFLTGWPKFVAVLLKSGAI